MNCDITTLSVSRLSGSSVLEILMKHAIDDSAKICPTHLAMRNQCCLENLNIQTHAASEEHWRALQDLGVLTGHPHGNSKVCGCS